MQESKLCLLQVSSLYSSETSFTFGLRAGGAIAQLGQEEAHPKEAIIYPLIVKEGELKPIRFARSRQLLLETVGDFD